MPLRDRAMRYRVSIVFVLLSLLVVSQFSYASKCQGHFVNPIKDICWKCLFPLSIGNTQVVKSNLGDTTNATSPIGTCPSEVGVRVGLNIGFWEPMAIVDVTDTPYCLVNLGGHQLKLGGTRGQGGRVRSDNGSTHAFFNVHWYKYPLVYWLNILTDMGCMETGDFDIAYLTELDPTWKDDEMSFVLSPESILFANPIAQASCVADSLSATLRKQSLDSLFWCAGAQGSHYPLTGHVLGTPSPIQAALLLTERMNFKLHREWLITDSSPKKGAICQSHHYLVPPKSRYRYELVNQVADGKHCYPTGRATVDWEGTKLKANQMDQFGFLVWRKRNCTYL